MGIIRKTMSMGSLGAVDYRSDKERTAAYTKGARKEAKKQTKIMEEQTKRQAEHNAAMLAAQSGQAPAAPKVTQGSPSIRVEELMLERERLRAGRQQQQEERRERRENPSPGSRRDRVNIQNARRAEAKAAKAEAKAARKAGAQTPVAPQSPPPGWYPDQVNPALVRWFDGQNWTDHLQPRQEPRPV